MIRFQCLEGQKEGRIFEFDQHQVVLGRGTECQVYLDDEACSRQHARIDETADGYVLSDLDSTNGLRVNKRRVRQAVLSYGDRFSLGKNLFIFLSEFARADLEENPDALIEDTISVDRAIFPDTGEKMTVTELKRAHGLMQIAYRVSLAINRTLEKEDIYTLIANSLFETFGTVERICLFLRRTEKGPLEMVKNVSRGNRAAFPVSRSLLRQAEEKRVGILARDASTDERFSESSSVALMNLRSLMLVPMVSRNRFLGAIYVENCTRPGCFTRMDLELLTLLGNQAAFAIDNASLYEDLQIAFYETIRSLSNALEAKDKYTHGHSNRVARCAVEIGRHLGLESARLENLRTAAELHDIGKIAIAQTIIDKSGTLTKEEFQAIKEHPRLGVEILEPISFLRPILPFILHHHETYDGTGYPAGLKGEGIPLESRLIHLADALDAMTTQRSYNVPKTVQEALQECLAKAGTKFDPVCVKALSDYISASGGHLDSLETVQELEGEKVSMPSL